MLQVHSGHPYAKLFLIFGMAQVITGALCILLTGVVIAVIPDIANNASPYGTDHYKAPGLWLGVLFIVTGALGVLSGKKPKNITINASMLFTILSAIGAAVMVILQVTASTSFSRYVLLHGPIPAVVHGYRLHITLTVLALLQLFATTAHSGYSCASNCSTTTYEDMEIKKEQREKQTEVMTVYNKHTPSAGAVKKNNHEHIVQNAATTRVTFPRESTSNLVPMDSSPLV
uniref:uncharacterized protein LOC100178115 n=1 Tax=Ciona intestinalis TaxID=7719 RepID=UPI000EF533C8|nr:uncharacterized protein LOC100178115 [Ciona intestinalis]XP_026696264.1 uncharacterized protein LOC100178115 [Ciona intestinalis]XP_026696265.1 uncharacterized protein LOC100178115 [Ciona intestinalis]|eukprot:XP_018673233.2 uncharacterized protein LOC100178115 [Ciona intestinalis]